MATLGTMFTMTTYGTWLRGDAWGWIDNGKLMPPDPALESADRARLQHPPYFFSLDDRHEVGSFLGQGLIQELAVTLYALAIESWHVHFVIGPTKVEIAEVAKCAKDKVRYGIRAGRPIWSDGYDKRWCFDVASLRARIRYVERHNERAGRPARPWPFITNPTIDLI